jgi:two-component system cell cycle sensor histidine kinase/response regulator CckA
LTFSRRQPVELQTFDVNVVVSGMEAMLRRVIGEQVELVTRLSPTLDLVNADKSQIEQVVMNLAVNARDAMPSGGTLRIETSNIDIDEAYVALHSGASRGRHVMVAISDTGVGMNQEVQAHLFEPFYTTKERGKGTGLGLATVYGIVKRSEGFIAVDSEVGRGSTFKIYLPQSSQLRATKAVEPALVSLKGTETILLVDDQAQVRRIAREVLTRHGYTVLEASGGSEALDLIGGYADPVQLLLTDIVMPRMSGRELARELVERRPTIRILYMSGYTDGTLGDDGVLAPGVAFIQKPYTPKDLLQKVRHVLDATHVPHAQRERPAAKSW